MLRDINCTHHDCRPVKADPEKKIQEKPPTPARWEVFGMPSITTLCPQHMQNYLSVHTGSFQKDPGVINQYWPELTITFNLMQ